MLFLMTAAVGGQSALRCSSVNEVGIDYDISPHNITEEHKHKTQPPFGGTQPRFSYSFGEG